MTRLWLVRHGPTGGKAMYGWTDIPAILTDRAALAGLAAALPAGLPVVSSDLIRARATADAIAGSRLRLPDDPDLREVHFGDWEECEFTEVWTREPERAERMWNAPGDVRPPGGESWNELRARVGGAVDRLLAAHPGGVIAVAHFGPILTQVQRATGESAKQVFSRKLRHLSLTEIATGRAWTLERFDALP